MKRFLLVLAISLALAGLNNWKIDAQDNTTVKTSVDFKPGDAAQLAMLRVKIEQIGSALRLVGNIDYPTLVLRNESDNLNKQISAIVESYNFGEAEIIVDSNSNWVG